MENSLKSKCYPELLKNKTFFLTLNLLYESSTAKAYISLFKFK